MFYPKKKSFNCLENSNRKVFTNFERKKQGKHCKQRSPVTPKKQYKTMFYPKKKSFNCLENSNRKVFTNFERKKQGKHCKQRSPVTPKKQYKTMFYPKNFFLIAPSKPILYRFYFYDVLLVQR